MNKEAAGDDLGLTLQTGFATKALLGLVGSDRFRLAISADGITFFDGLIVYNATGIVDQPRLPRFKAYTNYDNYVTVDTWTKIGINNTDYNDQGAFDAANNRFVAPMDGTYLFGATLLYKVNSSTWARMRGRLVLNATTEIRGSMGEISGAHVSEASALWLQTMVELQEGDTVELQGYLRAADGYFAADADLVRRELVDFANQVSAHFQAEIRNRELALERRRQAPPEAGPVELWQGQVVALERSLAMTRLSFSEATTFLQDLAGGSIFFGKIQLCTALMALIADD